MEAGSSFNDIKCVGCRCSSGLKVFETHAGELHTACSHAACEACLRNLVLKQLPSSRERWLLEVSCPEPGCQKRLPQRLVLQVKEASALAAAISNGNLWPSLDNEPTCCPLCGKAADVYANRACGHAACECCWMAGLEDRLSWCRENAAMDIPCVHVGCCEGCVDVINLFKSPLVEEVRQYVQEVHVQICVLSSWCVHGPSAAAGPMCPVCGHRSLALLHCCCGFPACTSCWMGFVQQQLARCQASSDVSLFIWPQWHPGCPSQETVIKLLAPSLAADFDEFVARVEWQKHELKRLYPYAVPRTVDDPPAPPCPICGEVCLALLRVPGCAKDHLACQVCWAKWGEEQIGACRHGRHLPARCLWPGCECDLSTEDWLWHLLKGPPRLRQLVADLDRRSRLQRNRLYPPPVQVNCPQPGCLGIGYLGFDTVMCFFCEHQWDATVEAVESAETQLPDGEEVTEAAVAGVRIKRCPKCREYIEKNGGCDHMTCRCGHEFSWSTLEPWQRLCERLRQGNPTP